MKKYLSDPSFLSLVASNILVIILAIVQKWEVSTVLWIYWIQSIVIGFFQFLRILSLKKFFTENFKINNQSVQPTAQTKLFTAFFFVFHYGFFHFIYAIFLFNFFTNQPPNFTYLFIGGLIFFLNHTFSFYQNQQAVSFGNRIIDEQKTQNIGILMFSPYARVIPMHLTIMLGVILGPSALIIFLLLKTLVDLLMHTFKHRVN